ncbi:Eco57I restriction-modification methylase domain-containing protein [Rhabdobacter roseus]|uniref:site-specific DNA-methyltransferase (adenine-specific) n=1 Tax=Rhabdobacter roseus TaxID=1655419 RepID=A0A840TQ28_9BACT|nr:N-6 DNA methylase [Rhabdobacter roseus]MBB5283662.1 methylase of polypeptide subunit release factors [Rhabdobacter roseus]
MASLVRNYERKKLLGQIYTPARLVDKILDEVGLTGTAFLGKKVLDPACGDGRFLVAVVQRIIRYSPPPQLPQHLLTVHGWDIDPVALSLCRAQLDELVAPLGLRIDWNLHQRDALRQHKSTLRFDLIVGNPPYIRIQHLPMRQRAYLQQHYTFCGTGSTDAYLAFFELASRLLCPGGTCGFITPNSYFTSETARPLRQYFLDKKNLRLITNFGAMRVFTNAGTYAAISVFGTESRTHFRYELGDEAYRYLAREVPFAELSGADRWHLSVLSPQPTQGTRLGDLCQISVGLTTLSDAVYLLTVEHPEGTLGESATVMATTRKGQRLRLEKAILRPVVKASRLKSTLDPIREYILFPYRTNSAGTHEIIPEEVLRASYPCAYKYLRSVRKVLERRDNGRPNAVAWYAFGRAQSLDSAFGEKIVFSHMNKTPNFIHYPNPDCTLYSGYFIKYPGDMKALVEVLNSPAMAAYMAVAGRDFRGGWKGYNKKIVASFIVPEGTLEPVEKPD